MFGWNMFGYGLAGCAGIFGKMFQKYAFRTKMAPCPHVDMHSTKFVEPSPGMGAFLAFFVGVAVNSIPGETTN